MHHGKLCNNQSHIATISSLYLKSSLYCVIQIARLIFILQPCDLLNLQDIYVYDGSDKFHLWLLHIIRPFYCFILLTITIFLYANQLFYLNYFCRCGHCKSLVPEYEKAASVLKGVVKVVSVDATQSPNLQNKYRVEGFPSLKIFGQVCIIFILLNLRHN